MCCETASGNHQACQKYQLKEISYEVISKVRQNLAEKRLLMSWEWKFELATHRVTTENAPFADRNKNFLPFLKTFEIASDYI